MGRESKLVIFYHEAARAKNFESDKNHQKQELVSFAKQCNKNG
jgi:hypothetical protein